MIPDNQDKRQGTALILASGRTLSSGRTTIQTTGQSQYQ